MLDVQLEHGGKFARSGFFRAADNRCGPIPRRRFCRRGPSAHRRSPRENTPAKTPDASIAGAKRAPSSLVQLTISTGCIGLVKPSRAACASASSAASTPSTPSNLPPVGWVSRCEPMAIGGSAGFLPWAAREHVAHVVDGHGAAERFALRLEPVAHLLIEIGQSEAADTALCGGADLRGLHGRVPQALGVDLEVLQGGAPMGAAGKSGFEIKAVRSSWPDLFRSYPRLKRPRKLKTWMPATNAGMTIRFTRPRDHPLILRLNQGHRGCDSWNEREAGPAMGRWLFAASMLAVCSFVMGGKPHAQSRKPTAQEVAAIRGCSTKYQDDLDAGED